MRKFTCEKVHIMKGDKQMKKVANMLLMILAVSILAACGKSGADSQESTEPDNTPTYSVQLELKCVKNLIFSKYDTDIFVDGSKIGKLDHGATRTYSMELKEGTHTLVVAKEGSTSVDGTIDFAVSEDVKFKYKISCASQQVEIEEIVEDYDEAISDGEKDNANNMEKVDTNGNEGTRDGIDTGTETNTDNSKTDPASNAQTNSSLSYSTNDRATAKEGNTGVFSYQKSGKSYDQYWIIDFDEGYVYYFTEGNGDSTCDRLEIKSGDLNSVLIITYHDGGDEWSYGLHFKWKNMPDTLIMQDETGFEYTYSTTNLKSALELRDSKTIKDY